MTKNNHQQLMQATTERKHHVKLYRAGKLWLAAGITTAAMGIAAISGGVVANADANASTGEAETTQTTPNKQVTEQFTMATATDPDTAGDSNEEPQQGTDESANDGVTETPKASTSDTDNSNAPSAYDPETDPNNHLQYTGGVTIDKDGNVTPITPSSTNDNTPSSGSPTSSFSYTTPPAVTYTGQTYDPETGGIINHYSDGSTSSTFTIDDRTPADGQRADTSVNLNDSDPTSINPVNENGSDADVTPTKITYTLGPAQEGSQTDTDTDPTNTIASDTTGQFNSSELSDTIATTIAQLKSEGYILIDNGYQDELDRTNLTTTAPNMVLGDEVDALTSLVQKSIADYNTNHPDANLQLITIVNGKEEDYSYTNSGSNVYYLVYQVYTPTLMSSTENDAALSELRSEVDMTTAYDPIDYVLSANEYQGMIAVGSNENTLLPGSDGVAIGSFSKENNFQGTGSQGFMYTPVPTTYNISFGKPEMPTDADEPGVGTPMHVYTKTTVPEPVTRPTGQTPEDNDGVPGTTPLHVYSKVTVPEPVTRPTGQTPKDDDGVPGTTPLHVYTKANVPGSVTAKGKTPKDEDGVPGIGTPLHVYTKTDVPTPTTPNDTTPATPTPDTVTNVPTAPTTPSDVVPSTPEGDTLTETPTTPDNNDMTPAGPSADTLTPTAANGNQTTTTTAGDTTPTILTTSSNAQVETPNSAATPTQTADKVATLPQTSEQHANGLAILGLALLGGLLGLVAPRRRHN